MDKWTLSPTERAALRDDIDLGALEGLLARIPTQARELLLQLFAADEATVCRALGEELPAVGIPPDPGLVMEYHPRLAYMFFDPTDIRIRDPEIEVLLQRVIAPLVEIKRQSLKNMGDSP